MSPMLPIRAPASAAYTGVEVGYRSAVGLDAGRGTTPVIGVASAVHPLKIGRPAPPRRSRTTAQNRTELNRFSHAASLAEATYEV